MKTLILARHAKSSFGAVGSSDFERQLNERGATDAVAMALYLKHCGYLINQIISSDADRALATAEQYKRSLTPDQSLITHQDLYLAPVSTIVDIVSRISPEFSSVMIVGHNPGMSEALNFLIHEKVEDMPTCSVGIIQFDVANWCDIKESDGDLLGFKHPNNITDKTNN